MYYGKYRGIVTENDDPQKQGRLKVKVPKLFGDEELDWAYPCIQFAPKGMGFYFIPRIDDLVWVEFEAGEVSCPIWTGMWWIKDGIPEGVSLDSCMIVTPSGHVMKFNSKENEIVWSITDKTGQCIEMDSSNKKVRIKDLSGQNITLDSDKRMIQISNINGDKGVSDVSSKTTEASTIAVTGTYKSYNDTALSVESYMNNGISDFISSHGAEYISSLEGELNTFTSNILNECEGLLTQFTDQVKDNIIAKYEGIASNFESFYNTDLLPKITTGDYIDPAYLSLVMQGVDGIKTDIEGVKESLLSQIDLSVLDSLSSMQSDLTSKMETFMSENWGYPASLCENALQTMKTDFRDSIQSIGNNQVDSMVLTSQTAKEDKPIFAVQGQSIILDSENKYTEINHADGLKLKLDSTSKEISIIDGYGHKINMHSGGINIFANGGLINLG